MKETKLTLDIIQGLGMESQSYKPDHDDFGLKFLLPKTGFELTCLTVCNGEPCDSDSLEGMDGWLYITTKEEIERVMELDENQLFEFIEADNPEFDREDFE